MIAQQNYRILIADDNPVNHKVISRMLSKLQCATISVANGIEVLKILEYEKFDFILMDIRMPVMDGLEATRQIHTRLNPSIRPIIIAMTAYTEDTMMDKCLEAGMDDYIHKPVIITDLKEKLYSWSQRRLAIEMSMNQYETHEHAFPNEVVDERRLIDLHDLESDPEKLLHMLGAYLAKCEKLIEQLRAGLKSGNLRDMRDTAHNLRGSSLNYGAIELTSLASQLERALDDKDRSQIAPLLDSIEQAINRTSGQFARWVQDQAQESRKTNRI